LTLPLVKLVKKGRLAAALSAFRAYIGRTGGGALRGSWLRR
jgi:hypothetical protein